MREAVEPERASLVDAVEGLEARLADIAADSDRAPGPRAADLAALEGDLFRLVDERTEDLLKSGERGHPALGLVVQWRDEALRLDHPGCGADAEALVESMVEDEAARWRGEAARLVGDDSLHARTAADACFRLLLDATALDRESLARDQDRDDRRPLGGFRGPVRERFAAALAEGDVGEAVRRGWMQALLDAADVALTGVDDLAPELAALHLRLVARDIEWHLARVERRRGPHRRRLRRKLRRLRIEEQERRLQGRLAARFGARTVAAFERVIIWLIFLVVAILIVDSTMDLDRDVRVALAIVDTAACAVFLLEFFVRLAHVRGRFTWFARHALIDLLPSLPFGLVTIAGLDRLDTTRNLRAARLARLLRAARPIVRLARAFGFVSRGIDRLVRRYGHLLNHNVILFPRREERTAAHLRLRGGASRLWRLRARLDTAWLELVQHDEPATRAHVFEVRLDALAAARARGWTRRPAGTLAAGPGVAIDVPADDFFETLAAVTPEEIEADLGHDFAARCARAARMFARPPLRWLPFLRRAVPRLGPGMSDAQVTTLAAHSLGAELRRHHDRVFWFADLRGVVTPAEFIDRLGTTLFKAAFRPAYRLLLFSLLFALVELVQELFGVREDDLPSFLANLEQLVRGTLLLLGSICIGVLAVGWWMRRLAGQATAFYEQMASAQYIALTEALKGRHLERDSGLLERRVLRPEALVNPDGLGDDAGARRALFLRTIRSWLVEVQSHGGDAGYSEALDRTVMLYRDGLDGALFGENDVRTTSQLLGNPSLQQMRELSHRLTRKEMKALQRLDLSGGRTSFRGPYVWLSFVSKAMTQAVARLIVDYNRHAIPQDELPHATDAERTRYTRWLQQRAGEALHPAERLAPAQARYLTTSFKALSFLDDDPQRDAEVARRFGPEVLAHLQQDRRVLFREVFGTYPRHLRAKERRQVNLYRVYEEWLAGGRAFLIPLRLVGEGLRMVGRFVRWTSVALGEIRKPQHRRDQEVIEGADFATAVRKIDRMRGPIVRAALEARARFDPEYLGVRIPRTEESGVEGADLETDLAFIGVRAARRRELEGERLRAIADMRRLARLFDGGLLDAVAGRIGMAPDDVRREHVRAAAVAYRGDYLGVRSLLSANELLVEAAADAVEQPTPRRLWLPRPRLARAFRRWCEAEGAPERSVRRILWRRIARDEAGLGAALVAWDLDGAAGARERGTDVLAELLRHPGRVSEQLVTLRAVQTLSMIDLLNYREHVYRLGDYASSGDEGGVLCQLGHGTE